MPGSIDTALFNSTSSNNSTVDAGFAGAVGSVTINTGYTGTVSLVSPLAVAVTFTQKTGAFTAGGQALTLRNLVLSGGSFTASSGTTSIAGALKISGTPTFSANGGTVNFDGGGGMLSCGSVTFNAVTITNTAGTKTVGSNCSLPLGSEPTAGSGGAVALNGALTGTGTLTSAKKLTLGLTGVLSSGFSGLQTGVLIVNGTYDFGEYEPFDVKGNFTLGASGELIAPEGVASFARNFTINSASEFDANKGTLNFDSVSSVTLACGGKTFALVEFDESAGHKNIGGDCVLPLGAGPDLGKGGIRLSGTLSGSGTLSEVGTFEVTGSSPGLDSFAGVTDGGSLLVKSGAVLTAPTGVLSVTGNFTIDSGATFNANGGTVSLLAPPAKATKTITCNGASFNLVTISNGGKLVVSNGCTLPLGPESTTIGEGGQIILNGTLSGTGALTAESVLLTLGSTGSLSGFTGLVASGGLTVNGTYDFGEYASFAVGGDFTLNAGASFTAPAGSTASFAGDFINAGGTFEANEGTVELTGAGQALMGSTTFENLTKVAEVADTLTFPAGATQTIEGTLTLEGDSAEKLLSLVSSTPGTAWLLAGEGAREVKWVSVKDSTNSGTEISAVESIDGEKNLGWTF